jgi:hypothetical protein
MNGFVKFQESDELESFFSSPRIQAIRSKGQLVRSSSEPVVIFREIDEDDAHAISDIAKKVGGRVISSTQYEPLV